MKFAEATLFTYNATTGNIDGVITDLDFRWEAEVRGSSWMHRVALTSLNSMNPDIWCELRMAMKDEVRIYPLILGYT